MSNKPIYEEWNITTSADSDSDAWNFATNQIDINDYVAIDTIDISGIAFDTAIDTTTYNDISIYREGKQPIKIAETLEKIMERLSIIEPDLEKMEKYPALREAYENYRAIEALIANDESKD